MESLWRKQIKIIEDKQGKESSGMPHSQDRHAGVLHSGFNYTRRDVVVIGAGMTSSMIAALVLRDELCGIENPYKKLFSSQRINFRAAAGNFILDAGMSVKGLSKGLLHRPKKDAESLPCGHGGIVLVDGKRFACYRDEAGELHMLSARCSHMGCELEWNPDEKSWDCPCHGSRFDVDGNLLDNPSKKDR